MLPRQTINLLDQSDKDRNSRSVSPAAGGASGTNAASSRKDRDYDDDSDSDDDIVQSLDIKENQPPAKQEQAVVGAPNRSQKVFQMLENSDSDDDSLDETEVHADESVVGKTVKPDSREQPHQSHESEAGFYKPDTANDSSSDDENPSESDLLAALAHNNRS